VLAHEMEGKPTESATLDANSPRKLPAKSKLVLSNGEISETLTRRRVVADREVWRNVAAGVGKTLTRAVISRTADLGAALPDDLREVSPAIESGLVVDVGWGGLAEQTAEVADLIVVEQLGDDRGDVIGWSTGSDVLTVSSAISGPKIYIS
jgi:hypothetical protein